MYPISKFTNCAVLGLLALLSGCVTPTEAVFPSQVEAVASLPSYQNIFGLEALNSENSLHDTWQNIGGGEFSTLLNELLDQNLDLQQASARILQAEARRKQSKAGLFPQLSFSATNTVSRMPNLIGDPDTNISLARGSSINWDTDIFGAQRNEAQASTLRLDASELSKRDLERLLSGQIASQYVTAWVLHERIAITLSLIQSYRTTVELVDSRYRAGSSSATALDLQIARQNLFSTLANLPNLEAQYTNTLISIDVLLGKPAGEIVLNFEDIQSRTQFELSILNTPAQLFSSRPDVAMAKLNYLAALADVDVAKARRLPSISLTGTLSSQGSSLEDILDLDRLASSLAASIFVPIFQGGRLEAEVDRARAVATELSFKFAAIILQALAEVETALVNEMAARRSIEQLDISLQAAELSRKLARDRYISGQTSFLSVLETTRALNAARQDHIFAQERILRARIDLYVALGEQPGDQN